MAATTDIFERLRADHDKHRDLLDRIEATSGETPERKALFEEFTYEAKGHAAAEEQALYSTVLRKPPLTACARHSVAEHHEIEEMLNDVAAADMATGGWLVKFRGLKHKYLHHIEEEEDEMFHAETKSKRRMEISPVDGGVTWWFRREPVRTAARSCP